MAGNPYAMTGKAFYDGPTEVNHDEMGPNADYAMPSEIGNAPYNSEGYAPHATGGVYGFPDPFRTGQIKEQGYNLTGYPDLDDGATDWEQRHSDEGFESLNKARLTGYSKEFDLSSYRNPPEGIRPTQLLHPNNYGYEKPLDIGVRGEMHLSGMRYSLAEHPTDQNRIGGQQPFRPLRNTFRVETQPWDRNVVDVPNPDEGYDNAAGIGGFNGGSYRL